MGHVGTAPHILNLSTRWMQVVSLYTLAALCPRKESPVPTEQEAIMTPALVWML